LEANEKEPSGRSVMKNIDQCHPGLPGWKARELIPNQKVLKTTQQWSYATQELALEMYNHNKQSKH
jgi:hypothetical protein